ncbi:MAG TPA: hypothetical protein VJ141_05275 [Candidatus Limnocylindrales bacterium]|nr:hypothetical protein [Candidatus Limnocylindrales bacterium]
MAPDRHSMTELHRSTVDSTGANVTAGYVPVADGSGNIDWAAASAAANLPWSYAQADGGLAGDGVTDDTSAFQAWITSVTASGTQSGWFWFEPGTYLIGGALQDTGGGNGQILLPTVVRDATHAEVTLHFMGPTRPPFAVVPTQNVPAPGGYAIIKSTLTGGTGSASCISAGSTAYNNITVVIENLICIAPGNPTFTFWNLLNSQGATVQDVMIWTEDWLGNTRPTNSNAYGIKLPGDTQGNYTRIEGLSVRLFYVGCRGGDLVVATGLMISGCIVGWENPAGVWPSLIKDVFFNGTNYAIRGTGGASVLDVLRYTHEHSVSPYDTIYDLDDPSNYISGHIRWWNVEWAVGPDHSFTVNGGANTSNAEIGPLTSGAPTTANYLVGTAQAGLSAEIVVGTTPGGELGGTWAGPTVDGTHSGSSHAATQSAAEATAAAALAGHTGDTTDAHDASAVSFVPTGSIAATDVQGAIEEVATESGGNKFVVDPGAPSYAGTPLVVSVVSKFGIDGSGNPYYNAAGVTSGEEAALMRDPDTDQYLLRSYNF